MKKVIVVILLAAIGYAGFSYWKTKQIRTNTDQITLYGNIDIRQVRLGFRVGGRLHEVLVDEGDAVDPGMTVARLDDTPFQDDLDLTLARRDAAAAAHEKAINGPRKGEIAQATANVEELKANLDMAELTFERYQNLLETKAVSRETFDQAEATRDAARERLRAATEVLALLVEGTRIEDIAAAKAELRAAEASVAVAETSLSDTVLTAPTKGVVISRVHEPGAIIAAGETVMVVSLDEPVWARAYIPEPLLGLASPGKKVEVFTDTRPNKPYVGTIGFVSPVAEFTPKSVETPELRTDLVYRIRVIIDSPDGGMRQGMPVTIQFADERK